MLVELRQSGSERLLDRIELDDSPQPGRWFVHDARSYLVLQRRHRYALRSGRYQLASVVLLVKQQQQPADALPAHWTADSNARRRVGRLAAERDRRQASECVAA